MLGTVREEDELHKHASYAVESVEDSYCLGACITLLVLFSSQEKERWWLTESEATGEFEWEFNIGVFDQVLLGVM